MPKLSSCLACIVVLSSCIPFFLKAERLLPTVVIGVPVRNKAHVLSAFLGNLENLYYPKNRIIIIFVTDHNVDKSDEMLSIWSKHWKPSYHEIILHQQDHPKKYTDEQVQDDGFPKGDWTRKRTDRIIAIRQSMLEFARNTWADYLFLLDPDNFISKLDGLQALQYVDASVVAPLVSSPGQNVNFCTYIPSDNICEPRDDYKTIIEKFSQDHFVVRYVTPPILIDMRSVNSSKLSFERGRFIDPDDSNVDSRSFCRSAAQAKIPLALTHFGYFGWMMPLVSPGREKETELLEHLHLQTISYFGPPGIFFSSIVPPIWPKKSKFGFDQIYVINLDKRKARLDKVDAMFEVIGMDYLRIPGVDGKKIDDEDMQKHGIKILPGYTDPYYGRPMTKGEIGCFMSHYHIWLDIVKNGYKRVIAFEDDVEFNAGFSRRLIELRDEAEKLAPDWDYIYLARQDSSFYKEDSAKLLPGAVNLATVDRSYWNSAFLLSGAGAKKLLDGKPLGNMIAVDEYIPLLGGKIHEKQDWNEAFPVQTLNIYSAHPIMAYQQYTLGDPKYTSDTEPKANYLVTGKLMVENRLPSEWSEVDVELELKKMNVTLSEDEK